MIFSFTGTSVFALTALPCEETNTCDNGGVPAPTVAFSASPSSIIEGASSTLSWSASGASQCSASWTTSTATYGTQTVFPATTTSYSITCAGQGGSTTRSATVSVTIPTTRTLDIYISGTGSVYDTASGLTCSTSQCSWTIARDKKIVLAANPGTGVFSGACSGYAPCTITMNLDKEISVTFPPAPTLTLSGSSIILQAGTTKTGNIVNVSSSNISGSINYSIDKSSGLTDADIPSPTNSNVTSNTYSVTAGLNTSTTESVTITASATGTNGSPVSDSKTISVTVTQPPP
ncbi:MAG: hypothetical protein AAB945_01000, partial [Patescibacteria group bacterium]